MEKFTKNCIHPWKTVNVFGDGTILPCCGEVEGSYGNIKTDLLEIKNNNTNPVFRNDSYKLLRRSLLTGELQENCKSCRIVAEGDITTEELHASLCKHLGYELDATEHTLINSFRVTDLIVSITNKCNLRCIYCAQSAPKSNTSTTPYSTIEFYQASIPEDDFFRLLTYLCDKGLKRLNFVGLGEFTIYKSWHKLIVKIKAKFPTLHLQLVSNFSKPLVENDFKNLMSFNIINISVDTFDKELFEKIRVGANFNTVYSNICRLMEIIKGIENAPTVCFNITESDLIIPKLEDVFRFASQHGIVINFSNLYYVEGTVLDRTKLLKKTGEMPDHELLALWPLMSSLPRRLKAGNPNSDIVQIGPFYNHIRAIGSKYSKHYFLPKVERESDVIYLKHGNDFLDDSIILKNIFLGFDEEIRGFYFPIRTVFNLKTEFNKLKIMISGVTSRPDGNLIISTSEPMLIRSGSEFVFDSNIAIFSGFTHILLSIEPIYTIDSQTGTHFSESLINETVFQSKRFIRELILTQDVDFFIKDHLRPRNGKYYIWCAGERTKSLLEWTSLKSLNIMGIIDSNSIKSGGNIDEFKIHHPNEVNFHGEDIIIVNATNPYEVEEFIKEKNYDVGLLYIL
jgi:MoaA/NifB/PqqE/SkfB family radical SAM enzyme